MSVENDTVTGTSKWLANGEIAGHWGAGNFVAFKFTNIDERATSVRVGLEPSQGSGLVEIINDPDKNGVFKITDKDEQVFKVITTDGNETITQTFDLSGLELEEEPEPEWIEHNLADFNNVSYFNESFSKGLDTSIVDFDNVLLVCEDDAINPDFPAAEGYGVTYGYGESNDAIDGVSGPVYISQIENNILKLDWSDVSSIDEFDYVFFSLQWSTDDTLTNIFTDLSKVTLKYKLKETE